MSFSRRPHALAPLPTSQRPARLVFVAVEYDEYPCAAGTEYRLRRVCAAYHRRDHNGGGWHESPILSFDDPAAFWAWLSGTAAKRQRTIVVSRHTIRTVTLLDHIRYLAQDGWKLGRVISSTRLAFLPYHRGSTTLLFVDHGNIFPMPLPENPTAEAEVRALASAWRGLLALLDEHDLGDFELSIGSQAFTAFRHRFIEHPIVIHADVRADELERRACFGAVYQPCLAGVAPSDNYYYLDTNAMYPWIMATRALPWRLVGVAGRMPVNALARKLDRYLVVASVRVCTDEARYPVKHGNKTVYATGEFTTTLTTPDLQYAMRAGHVTEILAAAWYDGEILFSGFVNELWGLRRRYTAAGNNDLAKLVKSWMVALYGRWGVRRYEQRRETDCELDAIGTGAFINAESGEQCEYYQLAGQMWTVRRGGESANSFPAIMAHIAAHGRNRMWELREQAGARNTFVLLSDGLIVNQAGYERLASEIDVDRLGALKLKMSSDKLAVYSDVEFVLGDHNWLPGVPGNGVQIDDGVIVTRKEPRLGWQLQSKNAARYVVRQQVMQPQREFHCGVVGEDGWLTPLRLPL